MMSAQGFTHLEHDINKFTIAVCTAIHDEVRKLRLEIMDLSKEIERMSDELKSLTDAVAAITAAVAAAAAEMHAETEKILVALVTPAGIDPAAVSNAANTIQTLAASLTATVAAAHTAVNPPVAAAAVDPHITQLDPLTGQPLTAAAPAPAPAPEPAPAAPEPAATHTDPVDAAPATDAPVAGT